MLLGNRFKDAVKSMRQQHQALFSFTTCLLRLEIHSVTIKC